MDTPNWALVANGSMARLLELDPAAATHWTERQCLMHPAARLHGSAAGHEPPGHSIAGRSRVAVFASNPFPRRADGTAGWCHPPAAGGQPCKGSDAPWACRSWRGHLQAERGGWTRPRC